MAALAIALLGSSVFSLVQTHRVRALQDAMQYATEVLINAQDTTDRAAIALGECVARLQRQPLSRFVRPL